MNRKGVGKYLFGAILLLLVLYGVVAYNRIVEKDNRVDQSWNEVQSVYQRRLDLVPNLVNVVKGLSDFEQTTLTQVAAARGRAMEAASSTVSAENYQHQTQVQDELASAANRLILSVERYPQLQGTSAYRGLQTQLEGTERRIKVARNDFNAAVADYNRTVRTFPRSLVAGLFGYSPRDGFQAVAGVDTAVEVKF
ncbi:LemA family protein [Niabella terrae]